MKMVTLPVLDGNGWGSAHWLDAAIQAGACYLRNPPWIDGLIPQVLEVTRQFFALSSAEKETAHIRRSPHFRGYSEMHNVRDWREQFHLSLEQPPSAELTPYRQLLGPNLWPESFSTDQRQILMQYLAAVGRLGQLLLNQIAERFDLASFPDCREGEPPYLLMKLICYHPQPSGPRRLGVAPHCDWSWITILLQNDLGGLEIRDHRGEWQPVPPMDVSVVINFGELLQVLTGGQILATPHRVFNHSHQSPRLSIPVFVNPSLPEMVSPAIPPTEHRLSSVDAEHVHRVLVPSEEYPSFCFGESEWRRKGEGRWCYRAECWGE